MNREWLTRHRSAIATVASATAIVALVAGAAVVSGGYTAQRMDLGDAAVWVSNEARQALGRANTQVGELNSVLDASGASVDLVQDGHTVLVVDGDSASLDIVDPATSVVTDSVPIPPGAPQVTLASSRVILSAAGGVWTVPLDRLADFDSAVDPDLALGPDTVTSVDDAGALFAFSPSTGIVSAVDAADADAVGRSWSIAAGAAADGYLITSVSGSWAVLNLTTARLYLDGRSVDLAPHLPPTGVPVLQAPSSGGDEVLVAHREGLIGVPLAGTGAIVHVDGGSGAPAAPTRHGGCAYAAWADGASWRDCDGESATGTLPAMTSAANLVFQVNTASVVLNDTRSGRAWAVQQDNALIDNWDDLIDRELDEQVVEENDETNPPTLEKAQVPPVAVDDEFGARPGRTTVLPVLLNDYDANGDVLVIREFSPIPETTGRLDLVSNNQQLQLTLPEGVGGSFSFTYTIDDGRGGQASAVVTVTVRSPSENAPPVQVRQSTSTVETGGRVSTRLLGDWVDPDGDPVFLARAATAPPDGVSHTPDGAVVFTESGGEGATRTIGLTVSDGRDAGGGSLLVGVRSAGSVPLVAEPFIALAYAGDEIEISPLRHVRGGNGDIRLSAVPTKPDAVITPDFDGGGFRFVSNAVRTHYLEYSVTDGAQTATGIVRVDVSAPPDLGTTPITVPHTALLRVQQPADIDVLATDIDPTGGVLLVTGVHGIPADSGLRIEVIEQRLIRATLTKPLPDGSVTFGYRVSNGRAEADGTVTVIEIPVPPMMQAPVATNDAVSVRVGDVIDIRVLRNDEHPDGERLTLDPVLVESLSDASGVLFASGDVLRLLAPEQPGEYSAVYRVNAPDGQFATATVKISVREPDPETNRPPVPRTVTSRVLAGDTVRIRIPLSNIDPDGDSVQFLGQETNPELGAVVETGPNWVDYQAGEYSTGTDTFSYSVIDALGARATGIVRVGIAPAAAGARNPVAVEDVVVTRPGRTIAVRVLDNDSDPDGGALSVVSIEPTVEGAEAVVEDDLVLVTVPDVEGQFGFVYTIQNERGGSDSTFLTVDAVEDAPLSYPEALDTVLTLSDVIDRSSVDVAVLDNVFLADGKPSELGVSLVPGFGGDSEVLPDKRIRIPIGDVRQVIPFRVAHPDDPAIVAHAFVWVPGYEDALPQLRKDRTKIRVESEQTVVIDINEHVVAVGGKSVRLTDAATARATHSDGRELVVDEKTLRFTSADKYYGPASLSFTVTDGDPADSADGRISTIVLPIEVTPRENQPPSLSNTVIDFEPGQSKAIDLVRLTNYPYPDDLDELDYRILEPGPTGFHASLDGRELTLRADESTPKGTHTSISIAVRDDVNTGRSGRIELRVVASTRPIAQPAADSAIAPRGETTIVDVLANDAATNPFPGEPLRVVAVRGLESGSLPDGVRVVPSTDRSRLSVTVSPTAAPGNTTLQYQVADATGDSSRFAWGIVTISVQDRPDPVTGLTVTGYGDHSLSVAFGAGAFNNSPIVGYELALVARSDGTVLATAPCPATTCVIATPGNGQAHAVYVEVVALNGIGRSDPARTANAVWSDVVPPAPSGLGAAPLDGGLRVSWAPVAAAGGGTAVRSYVVSVAGSATEHAASAICTATRCVVDRGGLGNGSEVGVAVSARNEAYPALSSWTESQTTGIPFGVPRAPASVTVQGDPATATVTVSWAPFDGNGDAIGGYFVQRLVDGNTTMPSGPQACAVTRPAPGTVVVPADGANVAQTRAVGSGTTSTTFSGIGSSDTRNAFVVWGYNRAGCAAAMGEVTLRPAPAQATASVRIEPFTAGTQWDLRISEVQPRQAFYTAQIVAVDASGAQIPGTARDFSGAGWARQLFPTHVGWGTSARVQVRVCALWGTCGPWSGVYPSSPSPSISLAVPSRSWDETRASWLWNENLATQNAGHPATVSCGIEGGPAVAADDQSCSPGAVPPGTRVWLDVKAGGYTTRYWDG